MPTLQLLLRVWETLVIIYDLLIKMNVYVSIQR